jgi:uncharacterized membrane protein YfcA
MDLSLAAMLGAIAFGTYFQTVTGFGLGMIALGAASGLHLMPVGDAAVVVSLLTLLNSPMVLRGNLRHVDRRATGTILLGMLPATYLGIELLDYLDRTAATLLQFLLGAAITVSCVVLTLKPARQRTRCARAGDLAAGTVAGLVGGMFGFSGPALIFHLYRQPMDMPAVRSTLVSLFACSAAARVVFVGFQGGLDLQVWKLFAASVLLVVGATLLGRRYPPPLGHHDLKRIAFVVVGLIGVSLMVAALASYR